MIYSILLVGFVYSNTPESDYAAELVEFIEDFLKPVEKTYNYSRRYATAMEMIPSILDYCEQYNIDPLLVAVLISLESSWHRHIYGQLGEVGPLQVMPRYFAKRFDLTTLDGQLHAGISHLRQSLDECNQRLDHAINYYGSCRCEPVQNFARYRRYRYNKAIKKYRKKGEMVK
jgi:hypothetical protein